MGSPPSLVTKGSNGWPPRHARDHTGALGTRSDELVVVSGMSRGQARCKTVSVNVDPRNTSVSSSLEVKIQSNLTIDNVLQEYNLTCVLLCPKLLKYLHDMRARSRHSPFHSVGLAAYRAMYFSSSRDHRRHPYHRAKGVLAFPEDRHSCALMAVWRKAGLALDRALDGSEGP